MFFLPETYVRTDAHSSCRESSAAAHAALLIASRRLPRTRALETVEQLTGVRPSDAAVASEIRRWFACFEPEAHQALLRKKRLAALTVLSSLSDWAPALTGSVLSGDALEDDPVRILIRTDDEKGLALALLAMNIDHEPVESFERGRSFRTVFRATCQGEVVLITATNLPSRTKTAPPDEWQRPEEACAKLSERGLRSLLGVD